MKRKIKRSTFWYRRGYIAALKEAARECSRHGLDHRGLAYRFERDQLCKFASKQVKITMVDTMRNHAHEAYCLQGWFANEAEERGKKWRS